LEQVIEKKRPLISGETHFSGELEVFEIINQKGFLSCCLI
jgi:hypothetical protein